MNAHRKAWPTWLALIGLAALVSCSLASASTRVSDYAYRYRDGDQHAARLAVLQQPDIGYWVDGWTGGFTTVLSHVSVPCQSNPHAVVTGEAASSFLFQRDGIVAAGAARVFASRAMVAADMRATYRVNYSECVANFIASSAGLPVQIRAVSSNPLPQIGPRVVGTRVLLSAVSGARRVNIVVDLDELAKGRAETVLTITRPYDTQSAAELRTIETQYLHQIAQRIAP